MTRSRKRRRRRPTRNRRLQYTLIILAILTLIALLIWYCTDTSPAPNVIPRVLFSETANCTERERILVLGVMKNRIHNPAFGNSPTLQAAIEQPGAFSCVNDNANSNWKKTRHPAQLTPAENQIWQNCLTLLSADSPPSRGPSGRPLVYYHDKSISKPATWNNSKWLAIREVSTEHFIFYSIVPAE